MTDFLIPNRFDGQSFVVTGGSSGIGRAAAVRLHREGGQVLATGTSDDKLAKLREECPGLETIVDDASADDAGEALAARAKELFGTLDGAYLNAGFAMFKPHTEVTAADFDKQYGVNVRGVMLHARSLSPLLREGGSILITGSVAKNLKDPGAVLYASTKGATRAMTRALAVELAGRNIRVNEIAPGPIDTPAFDGVDEEMAQRMKDQTIFGRFGRPEELAAVACFLLSGESTFMTGASVVVDGGMTMA